MQTYLPLLQDAHLFTPNHTWCSENELWLKHYHAPPKSTWSAQDKSWWWGKSGIYKYAPIASMDGDLHVKDGFERIIHLGRGTSTRYFDQSGYIELCQKMAHWYIDSMIDDCPWSDGHLSTLLEDGESEEIIQDYVFCHWSMNKPEGPHLIRDWYEYARMVELHRQSNCYSSNMLHRYHFLATGITNTGGQIETSHVEQQALLLRGLLEDLKWDMSEADFCIQSLAVRNDTPIWSASLVASDRRLQDVITVTGKSDDSARRIFVREVKECVLERQFATEGAKVASFANWYDKFQFGATRDFLITSLGRPDL